jgi:hypothetical protein
MTTTPTADRGTLGDALLARLEMLEDICADAGLRVATNASALDAGQLAEGLADVDAAAERLRRLLARLPVEGESRADGAESA